MSSQSVYLESTHSSLEVCKQFDTIVANSNHYQSSYESLVRAGLSETSPEVFSLLFAGLSAVSSSLSLSDVEAVLHLLTWMSSSKLTMIELREVAREEITRIVDWIEDEQRFPDAKDRYNLLGVVYNSIPSAGCVELKGDLCSRIVRSASQNEFLAASLVRQAPHLVDVFQGLRLSEEKKLELYLAFSNVARIASNFEFQVDFLLHCLRISPNLIPNILELVVQFLNLSFQVISFAKYDEVVSSPVFLSACSVQPVLSRLGSALESGVLSDYDALVESDEKLLTDLGLEMSSLRLKMQMFSIVELFRASSSCTFAEVAESVREPVQKVEKLVVTTIRAGFLRARIDESSKTVSGSDPIVRKFGDTEWRDIASRLHSWTENLRQLAESTASGSSEGAPRSMSIEPSASST